MNIVVNGVTRPTDAGMTVAALIRELELEGKRLAVEVNEGVVPRSEYGAYRLEEGDRIEIVQALGGG